MFGSQSPSQAPNTGPRAAKGPSCVKGCLPPAPIPTQHSQTTKTQPLCCCRGKSNLSGLPGSLLTLLFFPWRRGRRDAALSQAAATTLKPEGGIRLPRDTADQGQASPGTARSSVLPMSKSGDAQPPRGLGLTLALPRLLPGYPTVFLAVSKARSGPRLTLVSRFYASLSALLSPFSFLLPSALSLSFVSPPPALISLFLPCHFPVFKEEGKGGSNPRHARTHAGCLPCSVTR